MIKMEILEIENCICDIDFYQDIDDYSMPEFQPMREQLYAQMLGWA